MVRVFFVLTTIFNVYSFAQFLSLSLVRFSSRHAPILHCSSSSTFIMKMSFRLIALPLSYSIFFPFIILSLSCQCYRVFTHLPSTLSPLPLYFFTHFFFHLPYTWKLTYAHVGCFLLFFWWHTFTRDIHLSTPIHLSLLSLTTAFIVIAFDIFHLFQHAQFLIKIKFYNFAVRFLGMEK